MATARGDNCTKCRLGCMKCQYRGISAYRGFMPNHRDDTTATTISFCRPAGYGYAPGRYRH